MGLLALVAYCAHAKEGRFASDVDEFKAKRKEVYEFTQKPVLSRDGDRVEITFESKDFCDVTVAVEDDTGRIVRHLVSGLLGDNAPEPLQKGSLKQRLVWDSKDDQGHYVDDLNRHVVRVSLGLQPRFERTLFWSPHKRISAMSPLIQAAPEGIYVFEGCAYDHLRLFGHDGNYVRTVYPFPAPEVAKVDGVRWHDYPHDFKAPMKNGMYQDTLLTSGSNAVNHKGSINGVAAHAMAVRDGKVALGLSSLNRFSTEGSGCGVALEGPRIGLERPGAGPDNLVSPTSMALSPDGKWVYCAGYGYYLMNNLDTVHVVTRMPFDGPAGEKTPEIFAGKYEFKSGVGASGFGKGDGEFISAASVDCDGAGRVYVADFGNDRVQVFSPEGKHLKNIAVSRPAVVRLHRRTQEVYVFSWPILSRHASPQAFQPTLYRLGAFDNPKPIKQYELPMPKAGCQSSSYKEFPYHLLYSGEIDSWSDTLTIWLGREAQNDAELGQAGGWGGRKDGWDNTGVKVLREKDGKLEPIADFGAKTVEMVKRARAAVWGIQKFAFDPKRRKLYVHEGDGGMYGQSVRTLMELDPESGKVAFVTMPFTAQDVAFDYNGLIYLRTVDVIARYDPSSFPRSDNPNARVQAAYREVPWDYGEEFDKVGDGNGVMAPVMGGLVMPSQYPVCAHTGGLAISPKGNVVAACNVRVQGGPEVMGIRRFQVYTGEKAIVRAKPYQPQLYRGRGMTPTSCCLHVFDKHGKFVYEDAVPGMTQVDGVGIDGEDRLYAMAVPTRVLDGKPYFNEYSSTLVCFNPRKGRFVSDGKNCPLPLEEKPEGPAQLAGGLMGQIWTEGAEWFYGGVGFASFNAKTGDGGCACRFARFCLDGFARSIAPEPYQFGVAVVDRAGNLILRIGKFGNVDDGVPMCKDGGPVNPRSVGGDEVALFHACYAGTDTDRRIFISDTGNGRILSVQLSYAAEARVAFPKEATGAPKR